MEKITVVIADDHCVYRDGLKAVLEADEEISVIGEAANGKELVAVARELSHDVILTDLVMKGGSGVEAIKILYQEGFRKMIAISTFESERLITEALEAGALGYLMKYSERGEPAAAVKSVYRNERYYCKSTSGRLIRLMANSKFNPEIKGNLDLLSDKDKQIIRLLCEEKTNEEIAKVLFMSKRTVDGVRARIMEKLNVKTLAGVTLYAIRNSIYFLKPEDSLPENLLK